MQFWLLHLALGDAVRWLWARASLAHAHIDGFWGTTGTGLTGSNPAAILPQSFAGSAQPSLRISSCPQPCSVPGPLLAKGAKQDQLHNHNLLELGQSRSLGVQTSSQRFKGGKWGGTQICARVVGDVSIFLSLSTVVFGYDNGSGLYQYLLLPSSTKLAQQPISCRALDAAHIPGRGRAGLPPGERQHQEGRDSIRIHRSQLLQVQQMLWQSSECPGSGFSVQRQQWSGTSFV